MLAILAYAAATGLPAFRVTPQSRVYEAMRRGNPG